MTIDASALERQSSPPIPLLSQQTLRASGAGDAVTGFSAFERVYLTVAVAELRKASRDDAVSFTVEQSADGDSWTTAAGPIEFTTDQSQYESIDSPGDQLRVTWAFSGRLRSCRVTEISATPGSLDEPDGPGGPFALDDLTDVDTSGGEENDVVTQLNDGSFGMRPPTGGGLTNLDGGSPSSVFTVDQNIDGGGV